MEGRSAVNACAGAALLLVTLAACSSQDVETPPRIPTRQIWPGASNTGPPAGASLSAYSGSCEITKTGTVLDLRMFNCDIVIQARNVKITRSSIAGRVAVGETGSVSISDSLIDSGQQDTFPTIGQQNIALDGVEVRGGQHSVQCQRNCVLRNSWLHAQATPSEGSHQNAFISNGGTHMELFHNTLSCSSAPTPDGHGCTADVSLFGDFASIRGVSLLSNLFVSNGPGMSYCAQLGQNPRKAFPEATDIVVKDNVFEKGSTGHCAAYGAVTAFNSTAEGNVWSGNRWSDGRAVMP